MRTIFLSDIHAGPGLGPWEWIDEAGVDRLDVFFSTLPGHCDRVVLLGDIFDHWIVPHDLRPPPMPALLQMGPAARVCELLRLLAAQVDTVYVRGNHDDTMTREILPPGVRWSGDLYVDGQLRAEHGHQHALFCAEDPDNEVPLGYYISRLAATADRDSGGHVPTRQQIVQELLDAAVTRETLAQSLVDAVAARAGVSYADEILLPDGGAITVGEVRGRYRDLLSRFTARRGGLAAALAIPAETGSLELVADRLLFMDGASAVVLGHTHRPGVWSTLGRTYANTGSWVGGQGTWVELDGGVVVLKRLV